MKPSERKCMDGHDEEPLWILICGNQRCNVNILADEFEGTEYVNQLERRIERARAIVEALHRKDGRYYLVCYKIIDDLKGALLDD